MSPEPCEVMHLLIQADVDGELEPAEAARVAAHLDACPACTRMQTRLLDLSSRVRAMPRHPAPAPLRAAVRAKIAGSSAHYGLAARHWRPTLGATGLALAASLAVFAVLPRGDTMPDWIVAAHIRALQPNHLTDVVSSEQHTVKPWFGGRLPFAPPVKDLAGDGFPLVGGRLDYLPGNPAAALVYKRRQHVIDLFIWPAGEEDYASGAGARDGYNYVRWQGNGMAFWAVSDLNPKELGEFATLWR
ncbi:anti-sigma factor family protein [Methylobacterium durans]|uniref:Anti-sigma factor n=1 Tax=Methylobacterium durans TaxID=2202825 RepID=A0A2U8W0U3_9HYPH|nr:anti-sigma factor [Methylobacterium durans]AWN39714.1 anti-sigma factor [Methylobacterium durans]AWN42758.1 anti-sigma factor [Methylobacterium durans]